MSHSHQLGARYCKLELGGESSLYICPRDEYCCNVGCCISPTFQFYQLWYYWFMVFFMFLVCSGGQWWYKYVMQGRCASTMPPPSRRSTSYPRQCRVAYTPARDTVVLHHLWKPPNVGVNGPPPSYSQSGASCSGSGAVPKPSPYIQLYGPPPSYESVVASSLAPVHLASGSSQQIVVESGDVTSYPPPLIDDRSDGARHQHHRREGSSSSQQRTVGGNTFQPAVETVPPRNMTGQAIAGSELALLPPPPYLGEPNQLRVDTVQLQASASLLAHSHHHHRQSSTGSMRSSLHQSPVSGGSNNTKRCSSHSQQHYHHHHHQHNIKAPVNETRDTREAGGDGGQLQVEMPPNVEQSLSSDVRLESTEGPSGQSQELGERADNLQPENNPCSPPQPTLSSAPVGAPHSLTVSSADVSTQRA